jgi:hypothetical protein
MATPAAPPSLAREEQVRIPRYAGIIDTPKRPKQNRIHPLLPGRKAASRLEILPCMSPGFHSSIPPPCKGKAMSTIKLLEDAEITAGPDGKIVERILLREKKLFNVDHLSNVWKAQAHLPGYIEASWNRSRATMQRGDVPPIIKEMTASAISIINVCHY